MDGRKNAVEQITTHRSFRQLEGGGAGMAGDLEYGGEKVGHGSGGVTLALILESRA